MIAAQLVPHLACDNISDFVQQIFLEEMDTRGGHPLCARGLQDASAIGEQDLFADHGSFVTPSRRKKLSIL